MGNRGYGSGNLGGYHAGGFEMPRFEDDPTQKGGLRVSQKPSLLAQLLIRAGAMPVLPKSAKRGRGRPRKGGDPKP